MLAADLNETQDEALQRVGNGCVENISARCERICSYEIIASGCLNQELSNITLAAFEHSRAGVLHIL